MTKQVLGKKVERRRGYGLRLTWPEREREYHEFDSSATEQPLCRKADAPYNGRGSMSSEVDKSFFFSPKASPKNVSRQVAAIRHISHSYLDPNDFTVVNCIVKGHASLSPPSLRLRLCSRFTLRATYTYFDPKDFCPHPSTVSKVMRPFHLLLNKKQRKK
ncbi:hypothetical protein TNCV_1734201 [Trichonephila clavipes]|nr:hypothetical protein TNCV_1734201 [Trichonephila clavipes]